MRYAGATLMLLLAWSHAGPAAAQPAANQTPASNAPASVVPSPEQIAAWVRQLDGDRFAQREEAMEHLISAGAVAVRPVIDAIAAGGSAESGLRGLLVLKELALAGDANTEEAARAGLQSIADAKTNSFARRASATLATLDSLRHQRAVAELERLGAKTKFVDTVVGMQLIRDLRTVEIGEGWTGEEKDLRWLKWLGEADQIVFRRVRLSEDSLAHLAGLKNLKVLDVKYVPIGDAAIDHLKELKGVFLIKLYGTAISKEGADKLQTTLANAKVDLRQGGFLGVGGQAHPKGFAVNVVQAGSAADKSDLRADDVIVKYNDKPIADFEALTAEISKNSPGDMIRLEILRGEETLMKSLTLSEWDERATP